MSSDKKKSSVFFCLIEGLSLSASWRGNALLSSKAKNLFDLWSKYPHAVLNQNSNDEFSSFLSLGSGIDEDSNEEYVSKQVNAKVFSNNSNLSVFFSEILKNNSSLHLIITIYNDRDNDIQIDSLCSYLKSARSSGIFNVFIHLIISGNNTNDPREIVAILNRLERKIDQSGTAGIISLVGENYILNSAGRSHLSNLSQLFFAGKGKRAISAEQAMTTKRSLVQSLSDTVPFRMTSGENILSRINNFDGVFFCDVDNKNITSFISELSQKSISLEYQNKPKFLKTFTVLKLFNDQSSETNYLFDRERRETFSSLISRYGLSQLYITDDRRIEQIQSCLGVRDLKQTTSIVLECPNTFSLYVTNYNSILDNYLSKIKSELDKNEVDFFFIDIPLLYLTTLAGSFKETVTKLNEIDIFLGKLKEMVFKYSGALILTSINSPDLINQPKSLPPLPFIFILDGILKNSANKSSNYKNDIMYDLLNKKYEITDLAPTILDLFKISKPDSMKGQSLLNSKILR